MKRLLRWLMRPLAVWLCEEITHTFGVFDDGSMFIRFEDGFGIVWYTERTPDEMREKAWDMIGMADMAEQDAIYQE